MFSVWGHAVHQLLLLSDGGSKGRRREGDTDRWLHTACAEVNFFSAKILKLNTYLGTKDTAVNYRNVTLVTCALISYHGVKRNLYLNYSLQYK